MRTIKLRGVLNKTEIRLFDSIDELTAERDHEFWRLVLQDIGIGSDLKSYDKHLGGLYGFLKHKDMESAIQEIQNMRSNIFYMIEKIDLKSFCFATMIHSINGKVYDDFTEDGIKDCIKELSRHGLKGSEVREQVEDIKKKLKSILGITSQTNTEIQA